jgi:hypothetical protein
MKILIIILALVMTGTLYSQENLVPNGDFSDSLTTNFQAGGHYYLCEGWWLPHWGSSDYYHHESDLVYGPNPENSCCGMAYCNFGCPDWNFEEDCVGMVCGQPGSEYRELIECELTEPLEAGVAYEISFRLLRADSCGWACNEINVGFSDTLIDIISQGGSEVGALPIVGVFPQSEEVFSDQSLWLSRDTQYIASGNEKYMLLGNFLTQGDFDLEHLNPGALIDFSAYYYIDDVKVKKITDNLIEHDHARLGNAVEVYGSLQEFMEAKDLINSLQIELYNSGGVRVMLYERQRLFASSEISNWIPSAGMYYYRVIRDAQLEIGRILISND